VTVTFTYNGSSSLATQINQGAPAYVFASASPKNMTSVTDQHMAVGARRVRRDDHLRGQPARRDADDAAGDLHQRGHLL